MQDFFKYIIAKMFSFFCISIPCPAVQLETKPSSTLVPAFQVMSWRGFALGISKAAAF